MVDTKKAPAHKTAEAKQAYDERVANQGQPKTGVRRMLTPAERVAKLEAELEAARKAAEAKAEVQVKSLLEKRDALTKQITERQAKVRDIDTQLSALGHDVTAPAKVEASA